MHFEGTDRGEIEYFLFYKRGACKDKCVIIDTSQTHSNKNLYSIYFIYTTILFEFIREPTKDDLI